MLNLIENYNSLKKKINNIVKCKINASFAKLYVKNKKKNRCFEYIIDYNGIHSSKYRINVEFREINEAKSLKCCL